MANSYVKAYLNEAYQMEIQQNLKYKKKLSRLKKLIKNTVFENAALCDQVAQMQENLVIVKEERLMLLKKLCQVQGEIDPATLLAKSQMGYGNSASPHSDMFTPKKNAKKRNNNTGDTPENKSKAKRGKTTRKVVQLIPLDVHGRPIFPISLGDLTIYSLGDVITDRPAYHTEDLIYPVGYCSTRVYASLKDARMKSLYTCKILDGGIKPRFEIVSDTELDQPLVGSSPDECHTRLLTAVSASLKSLPPKGADFFGISHPTIQNLIQSSPGTRKLTLYKPIKFEISKKPDRDASPNKEDNDPGLSFTALHRHYALTSIYGMGAIKQEPGNALISFQEFLS